MMRSLLLLATLLGSALALTVSPSGEVPWNASLTIDLAARTNVSPVLYGLFFEGEPLPLHHLCTQCACQQGFPGRRQAVGPGC